MIQKLLVTKPIILADFREREIIEILKNNKNIKVIEDNLPIDFIIGDIGIERKTLNDFLNSTFDKRIFEQIQHLNNFRKIILIVENFADVNYLDERKREIFYGMISKILASTNVSIIFSNDIYETSKILEKISEKYGSDFIILPKTKFKKKPKEIEKAVLTILASFPGISFKTAEKIIKHFKSIKNFINAKRSELVSILGEKRAKKIEKIINYEFKQ
ncbi:MAG: ERCC4 domain-containing protein [Candidatus Aenigmatarchaeota archaeon]